MFAELNKTLPEFTFKLSEDVKLEFTKLNGISQSTPLLVKMMYLNKKGKFGDQYVVVAEDSEGNLFGVNLPGFMTEEVDQIRRNKDLVDGINAGKCGIKCSAKMTSSNGRDVYRPVWVDLE